MPVKFDGIEVGSEWDRNQLAERWGYKDFHPLARGVITPAGENKIILFITCEKQSHSERYADIIDGDALYMDGEVNHGSVPLSPHRSQGPRRPRKARYNLALGP